ncbi:histidine kinase [Sediminicola sp. YIK13]|uniref:sensor histidine kinase n=1 Tax=Sediminicola sp. YIK13 TaxID=1453352 RepID=UPI0007203B0C|nr:histidine kinase [Sediminicola sp. YIK13]ALM09078.1 histidine kinase [Sediminicola sp. YIK13]
MSTKNTAYWILNIAFWSVITGLMAFAYWINDNDLKLKNWQFIMDFTIVLLLSIFYTHQLKRSINIFIQFDNLKGIDVFKVLGLLIASILLFYITFSLYIQFAYHFIYDRADVFEHESQGLKGNLIFIINYSIYFLVWTGFYVAVKGLMELNNGRETRLQLESNLKESQLNTLKGQINPHFMFNSLNNIRGLMLEDVDRARNMLTSLSETLRYSLTKSDSNAIALEDELEMVENYIEISKIQFENRLRFNTNIDNYTLNILIPPMIIQMLVENAIKHGISNLKEGGTIILSTTLITNQLSIEVANTGKLSQSKDSTQLGLKNIEKRLELLYGDAATFNLKEKENQVIATIKIPVA